MRTVENYIVSLLHRHDCVVMPDFGGFVLHPQAARFGSQPHELRPPSKGLSFNISLHLNDGLLAQHIAVEEGISYEAAMTMLLNTSEAWKQDVYSSRQLVLEELGLFRLTDDYKWLFEPTNRHNFRRDSFGLSPIQLVPVDSLKTRLGASGRRDEKILPLRWKRVAIGAAATVLAGAVGLTAYQKFGNHEEKLSVVHHTEETARSIDEILSRPEAEASEAPQEIVADNLQYYVIGGSFSTEKNAGVFASKLRKKGFTAEVLNNDQGIYRVAYLKEKDSLSADQHLQKIKLEENQKAWILKW